MALDAIVAEFKRIRLNENSEFPSASSFKSPPLVAMSQHGQIPPPGPIQVVQQPRQPRAVEIGVLPQIIPQVALHIPPLRLAPPGLMAQEFRHRILENWRNPNDNNFQLRGAFPISNPLSRIIGVNLNLAPVIQDRTSSLLFPFLYLYARGEVQVQNYNDKENMSYTVAIANLIAPLTNIIPLDQEHSQNNFAVATRRYLTLEFNRRQYINVTDELFIQFRNEVQIPTETTREAFIIMVNDPMTTPLILAQWLRWLVEYAATDRLKNMAQKLYILALISFVRRGNMTETKLESMINQLQEEGFEGDILSAERCHLVYSTLSSVIDENVAANAFPIWREVITPLSMRMSLILLQTVMSGLTVIRDALRVAPDFPWAIIGSLLPEVNNARLAFLTVGNNPYYGFKKDLGEARSSKFKSLTYVCKSLLLKVGGPEFAGLKQYRGFTNNPLHKVSLDRLVRDYNPMIIDEDTGLPVGVTPRWITNCS